jgi:hypothetical protein
MLSPSSGFLNLPKVDQVLKDINSHFRVFLKGPRSRCCGRTAALRLLMQPCDEDDSFFVFPCNGAPVEWN